MSRIATASSETRIAYIIGEDVTGKPIKTYIKSPTTIHNYILDWTRWMGFGDRITASNWTVPGGLTEDLDTFTTTTSSLLLHGGTAGTTYDVSCAVTTLSGLSDTRTIRIVVMDR